jgi:uncharacterized protein (DUF2267 family)
LIVVNLMAWFKRLRDSGKQNWRLRIDGDQGEMARPIVFLGDGTDQVVTQLSCASAMRRKIMSTTGLEVFDKTVQTTNAWLKEIMEVTGPDRLRAYRVLTAVLHALRDRLTVDEAAQLGAQLPILVRGLYYDQWHHPSGKPERLRHKEEFLAAVAAELDDIRPINPEQATRAVFSLLEHHIAPGEIEDIKATLPAHLRELWP